MTVSDQCLFMKNVCLLFDFKENPFLFISFDCNFYIFIKSNFKLKLSAYLFKLQGIEQVSLEQNKRIYCFFQIQPILYSLSIFILKVFIQSQNQNKTQKSNLLEMEKQQIQVVHSNENKNDNTSKIPIQAQLNQLNQIENNRLQQHNNKSSQQGKDTKIENNYENKQLKQNDRDSKNEQKNNKLYGHNKKKRINKKHQKQEPIVYSNLNPFKQQEKLYKLYQGKQTDFSTLFNLKQAQLLKIQGHQVFVLPGPENGAYLVKNFNNSQIVNKIGSLGLNTFWRKPYRTNLNSRSQLYAEKKDNNQQQVAIKNQQQKANQQANQGWFKDFTEEQFKNQIKQKGYCFNDKIRWANVGHQYDWTLRKYPQYHTPMHQAIKDLTDRANLLYNEIIKQNRSYQPQSAIINYYGTKDYMTGHLDDAQEDQQSPIYSFSFGLSCVFLMGGMTKDQKPCAVRLDSGDLFIMSKNSRKCYHGVPRIIEGSYKSVIQQNNKQLIPKQSNQNGRQQVQNYFNGHRININIRQVFPEHKNQQ